MRFPALILAALALVPAVALAQPVDSAKIEEAKTYFEAGRQAYEAQDYLTAVKAFELAYQAVPKPEIAFSLAQAYRRLGVDRREPAMLHRALELYNVYLQAVPQGGRHDDAVQNRNDIELALLKIEGPGARAAAMPAMTQSTQLMVFSRTPGALATIDGDAPVHAPLTKDVKAGAHKIHVEAAGYFAADLEGNAVEGRLVPLEVNLRERPARLAVATSDGADVLIDGRPAGSAPVRPLELSPGRHFIALTMRGRHAYTRELNLERGQELSLDARLETTGQRKASYWVLGAAGLLLVGGGVTTAFALVAQNDAQGILDKRAGGNISEVERAEYDRQRQRRDDYVTLSGVLYGGAVAVGVTGLLLYLLDSPRVEAPPESGGAIVPVTTPDTVGAAWVGRF